LFLRGSNLMATSEPLGIAIFIGLVSASILRGNPDAGDRIPKV
jgi:hypothetical protein